VRATAPLAQAKGGAKKGGSGAGGAAAAAAEEKYDITKVVPVNILKEGSEPEYKADSEYPPWIFKLLEERPVLDDLLLPGIEKMSPESMKRALRMVSKRRIKAANMARAKGGDE
jgi:hypothetical protein